MLRRNIVWIAIVLLAGGWFVKSRHDDKQLKLRNAAARAAAQAAHFDFGRRYNAISNWEEQLPRRDRFQLFSADIAEALVGTNNRPVLFLASLDDISLSKGRYFARLTCNETDPPLALLLMLDAVQAQLLRQEPTDLAMDFSLVARIREVKLVPAGPIIDEDSDGEPLVVEGQTENLCLGELLAFQQYSRVLTPGSRFGKKAN